jgi:hypothetical protein
MVRAEEDLAITFCARTIFHSGSHFANEIPPSIPFQHEFEVAGAMVEVGKNEFLGKSFVPFSAQRELPTSRCLNDLEGNPYQCGGQGREANGQDYCSRAKRQHS